MEKDEIINNILELMSNRLKRLGITKENVDINSSLLEQGIYDSMAFIEFISLIEESMDVEFDFEEMDAADFTSVSQLADIIYNELN
jgi:acyl carrier protein